MSDPVGLPARGTPPAELFAEMRAAKREDADWHGGRTWSLVYHASDAVDDVVAEAHALFLFENALNPRAFPSLKRFETEVISMTAALLNGPHARGSMTSGGSESILLAVKTARDRARAERDVDRPTVVAPLSAHPAFDKAAHFCDVEMVHTGLRDDFRADVGAVADAVDERTCLVVGSAFGYPHGVVDPIPELAAVAADTGVSMHVDACLGGFILPFLERLGHPVPPFDFRVDGVTSMSADVHKYGFTAKGASVLLHRDRALYAHQPYGYDGWPGGLYGTRGVQGARPGGPIAGAWAVMRYLGEEGYLRLARAVLETTHRLLEGVRSIDGLRVLGDPDGPVFAFTTTDDGQNVFAVGDAMDARGWHLDRQQLPDALHLMVSPGHARVADRFLDDLRAAVNEAGFAEASGGQARYGE